MQILGIAFLSAGALMLEVSLARLLSIAHGEELSYMVISLALLGYGLATPFLCRQTRFVKIPPARWGLFFASSLPILLFLASRISLDAGRIAWEWEPWLKIGILYFLFSLPFFFVGLTIASLFMAFSKRSHSIYAGDLIGAGIGALLPFFLLPLQSCYLASLMAAVGGFFLSSGRRERLFASLLILIGLSFFYWKPSWEPKMSPSRGLPTALLDSKARHLGTFWSPWTRVDKFEGSYARVAPGLSLYYLGLLPRPEGMAINGDRIVPLLTEDEGKWGFLDYLPNVIPYSLYENGKVLLIETQGGIELAQARRNHSARIDLVERDSLFEKMYQQGVPGVHWHVQASGNYLKETSLFYDLIVIGNLGGTGPFSSGFTAMRQDYNLTKETLTKGLARLNPNGTLAIHLYRLPPPRLEYRLLKTIREVLQDFPGDPQGGVAVFRTLQTYTFLIRRTPFRSEEILNIGDLILERGYEFIYPSASLRFQDTETDQIHLLLEGKSFDYPFSLAAITEDRPYPYQSIRLFRLKEILESAKGHWQLLLEGGGLNLAVFLQALLGSLLILSVAWTKKIKKEGAEGKFLGLYRTVVDITPRWWLYFILIGLGFIFLEIGWINRLMVYLPHPSQSIPIVLGSMLIGAGLGSGLGALSFVKGAMKTPAPVCFLSGLVAIGSFFALPELLSRFGGWSFRSVPMLIPVFVLFSSLPLGIPFPAALKKMIQNSPAIPWAFGLNAFSSVCGAVLAAALIPAVGFTVIFSLAALCYLLAGFIAPGLSRSSEQI